MRANASRSTAGPARMIGCLLLLTLSLASLLPIPAFADDHGDDDAATELLSDDNLLIVEIVLGNYRVAQDVFIYSSLESTLVPLQPVFDALEFPIHVDPVAVKAHGWFLREQNRFDLNLETRTLTIGDQLQPLPATTQVLSDGFDVYVDLNQLNRWFPFTITLQTSRLRLAVESEQPLPLELQLAREKQRQQQLGRATGNNLPVIPDRYALLGTPTIDVTMGTVLQEVDERDASLDQSDYSYSLLANTDMLGMQGNLAVSRASSGDSTRERFTLHKKPNHPDKMMTGKLSAVALGDIFAPPDALVFSGGEGLGADLQFGGTSSASDFDKRIIEGDSVPGWEVELYRNGALLDFQEVGDDGRYRFEDVAVDYGENIFDIRLFGPQGQEESRRQAIRIDDNARSPGQIYARISHVDTERQLFGDDSPEEEQSLVVQQKSLALLQAGISQSLSMSAGYAKRQVRESLNASSSLETASGSVIDDQAFTIAGATISLPFASLNIQHADLESGGDAQLFGAQTRIGGTSISMSHKRYSNFRSDRNRRGTISSESELRFSGAFTAPSRRSVSYQVSADFEEETNGNYVYSLENRAGFQVFQGRMTIDANYTSSKLGEDALNGRVRFLRVLGSKTSFRASTSYTIQPELELGGFTANMIWRPSPKLRTQFGIDTDFTGGDNNSVSFSASYLLDRLTVSADARLAESNNSSLMLTAEFSLAREKKKRWRISGQHGASFGRIRARTFLDNNNNGEFDSGDRPIEGVFFGGRSSWEQRPTDEDGIVYLDGFRSSSLTNLKLDEGSLEDPFWKNQFPQSAVVSHGGALQHLDIPIVPTVEVEGSVLLETRDGERPLAGIPVQVTNHNHELMEHTLTEFDGFYIVAGLPPGEYLLNIDPEALSRFDVEALEAIPFSATAAEGIIYLPPIVLAAGGQTASDAAPRSTRPDNTTVSTPDGNVDPGEAAIERVQLATDTSSQTSEKGHGVSKDLPTQDEHPPTNKGRAKSSSPGKAPDPTEGPAQHTSIGPPGIAPAAIPEITPDAPEPAPAESSPHTQSSGVELWSSIAVAALFGSLLGFGALLWAVRAKKPP